MFHVPHQFRIRTGVLASSDSFGNAGAFRVPVGPVYANVVVSDGEGWEHVSVGLPNRCPTWGEMCRIKALFWDAEDTVIQFHPPESEYVNCHPYVLHLWRPVGIEIPRPPSILVGPRGGRARP